MIDQLLDVLKIAFLVLLYLFFLRVLWVVLNEVRSTRTGNPAQVGFTGQPTQLAAEPAVPEPPPIAAVPPSRGKRGRKGSVGRLQVLEPRARKGTSYGINGELTLGRSTGCTVTIDDDAFISNLHARVYLANGEAIVEDLGSTNGTYLNGDRLQGARPLRRGDRVQLGRTVLEAQ